MIRIKIILPLLLLSSLYGQNNLDLQKKIDAIENEEADRFVDTIKTMWTIKGHSLSDKIRYIQNRFFTRHDTTLKFKQVYKLINAVKKEFHTLSDEEQRQIIYQACSIKPDQFKTGTEAHALYILLNSDYQEKYNKDYQWHLNTPLYELEEKIDQYEKAKAQQSHNNTLSAYRYTMFKKTVDTAIGCTVIFTVIFFGVRFLYKKYCEYKTRKNNKLEHNCLTGHTTKTRNT